MLIPAAIRLLVKKNTREAEASLLVFGATTSRSLVRAPHFCVSQLVDVPFLT